MNLIFINEGRNQLQQQEGSYNGNLLAQLINLLLDEAANLINGSKCRSTV